MVSGIGSNSPRRNSGPLGHRNSRAHLPNLGVSQGLDSLNNNMSQAYRATGLKSALLYLGIIGDDSKRIEHVKTTATTVGFGTVFLAGQVLKNANIKTIQQVALAAKLIGIGVGVYSIATGCRSILNAWGSNVRAKELDKTEKKIKQLIFNSPARKTPYKATDSQKRDLENMLRIYRDIKFCRKANQNAASDQLTSGLCDGAIGGFTLAAVIASQGMSATITIPATVAGMTALKFGVKVARGIEKKSEGDQKKLVSKRLLNYSKVLQANIQNSQHIMTDSDRALIMMFASVGLIKKKVQTHHFLSARTTGSISDGQKGKMLRELDKNGIKDINAKLTISAGSIHGKKSVSKNIGALMGI